MSANRNGQAHEIRLLIRPGRHMSDRERDALVAELREVAATCFDEIPEYQCLVGTREALADKVIAVARRPDGRMAGFCSTVMLRVPGVGDVMHLGLTCVRPEDRKYGLTHKLTSKAVIGYALRYRPFGRLWISNCACVLSSLGNVAMHFDAVYPTPFTSAKPGETHRRIAAAIDVKYRDAMYVLPGAIFDPDAFVFRGSVKDTVFQKEAEERSFHHRNRTVNDYYTNLLSFDEGDEVLQVGYIHLLSSAPRYFWRKFRLRRRAQVLASAER
ncbi:MAG: hypothetical protein IT350_07585 [Deltaproteobacteria bacterium]|nr:hypothetical protein [Deltaproteobacteria bacterium]